MNILKWWMIWYMYDMIYVWYNSHIYIDMIYLYIIDTYIYILYTVYIHMIATSALNNLLVLGYTMETKAWEIITYNGNTSWWVCAGPPCDHGCWWSNALPWFCFLDYRPPCLACLRWNWLLLMVVMLSMLDIGTAPARIPWSSTTWGSNQLYCGMSQICMTRIGGIGFNVGHSTMNHHDVLYRISTYISPVCFLAQLHLWLLYWFAMIMVDSGWC